MGVKPLRGGGVAGPSILRAHPTPFYGPPFPTPVEWRLRCLRYSFGNALVMGYDREVWGNSPLAVGWGWALGGGIYQRFFFYWTGPLEHTVATHRYVEIFMARRSKSCLQGVRSPFGPRRFIFFYVIKFCGTKESMIQVEYHASLCVSAFPTRVTTTPLLHIVATLRSKGGHFYRAGTPNLAPGAVRP